MTFKVAFKVPLVRKPGFAPVLKKFVADSDAELAFRFRLQPEAASVASAGISGR